MLLLLAACGGGSDTPSSAVQPPTGPAGVLLPGPPPGFSGKLDAALSLQTASTATPAQPGPTRQALSSGGYSAGQERVWVKGSEYVTAIVLGFSTEIDAANFVHFELTQIGASPAATVSPYGAITGATAFSLYGLTRQGSTQTFCQGLWFPAGQEAFELLDCADAPRYPNFVDGLAQQQYARTTGSGKSG